MSAMLETFDAPMTDYGSDDVAMQIQPLSDTWIQGDGTMDDDSFIGFHQSDLNRTSGMDAIQIESTMSMPSFSGLSTPKPTMDELHTEVEMQDDEEQNEYEMEDGEHTDEIQDVEVHDVSHTASSDEFSAPQITFSTSTETSASVHEITAMVAPESDNANISTAEPSNDQTSVLEVSRQGSTEAQYPVESHAAAPAELHSLFDRTEPSSEEHLQQFQEQTDSYHETEELPPQQAEAEEAVTHSNSLAPEQSWQEPTHDPTTDAVNPQFSLSPHSVERESVAEAAPEQESKESQAAEGPSVDDGVASHEELPAAGNDPHEVFAGVCIEPPPAVPLDIAFSELNFTLFNRKTTSGRNTPSQEESDSTPEVIVMLHDQPTLFYDPMISVWKALRKEVPSYTSVDLESLELMLTVPSLGLVLCEDNMYCQELCLHDLYALHEVYDDQNPLRLQLHTQERFSVRYAALQAGVHHEEEEDVEHHDESLPQDNEHGVEESDVHTEVPPEPEATRTEPEEQPHFEAEPRNGEEPAENSHHALADEDVANAETEPRHQDDQASAEAAVDHAENEGYTLHEVQEQHAEGQEDTQGQVHTATSETFQEDDDANAPHTANEEDAAHNETYDQHGENEYYDEDYDESNATTETPDEDEGEPYDLEEQVETDNASPEGLADHHDQYEAAGEDEASENPGNVEIAGTDTQQFEEEVDHADHEHEELLHETDSQQESEFGSVNVENGDNAVDPADDYPDFSNLPELPPDDEDWDDELDGHGEVDFVWQPEDGAPEDEDEAASNQSSATLSSGKGPVKRGFSEIDDEDEENHDPYPSIPTPEKRVRVD